MEETSAAPETRTRTLGVVGAGLMGGGLAALGALAGMNVRIFDQDHAAIRSLAERMRQWHAGDIRRGKFSEADLEDASSRLMQVDTLEEVAGSDFVVEAVIENLEIKQDVFFQLGQHAAEHTLLASNTSAISITDIAARSERPDQIIGMHFFSPVRVMQLCEIVRGYRTSDATLTRALELSNRLGKEHIVVERDDAGFVTSRLMSVLIHEAVRIVEQGLASPEDVDRACVLGFGHAMGPLATADLTGIDVSYRAGLSVALGSGDPSYGPPQLLRRMLAAGDLGRKTGRGFYNYEGETP